MANNWLKYSGLTYDSIIQQVQDKLAANPQFDNFRESAIASTMTEIFAGCVDIVSYYLERRSEENFMDTARLMSSVILLSRQLGYIVTRPIPAESTIQLRLQGDFSHLSIASTDSLQIPYHSVFSYGGFNFILKNTLNVSLAPYIGLMNSQAANFDSGLIAVDINGNDIEIVEGDIREVVIDGTTNPQIGSIFQFYKIDDPQFSNHYGDADFNVPVTKVWVGNVKDDTTTLYNTDRRSLINPNVIDASIAGNPIQSCFVRTSITEGVDIVFGDGRFVELGAVTSGNGAQTSFDNIYIQYLGTVGSKANQTGVKGNQIQFSGKVYTTGGVDITSLTKFSFATNINGGADIENIDSIRLNAPNIYYSLDRLVTSQDYMNYLRTLTSPIVVRNAIAWGEQEEITAYKTDAIMRMFNIVFFSVVGSLYQTTTSPYYALTKETGLDQSVLDFDYNEDELSQNNYFNIFAKGDVNGTGAIIKQLKEYQTSAFQWMINGVTPTNTDGSYFTSTYGNSMIFNFNYGTSNANFNIVLSANSSVTINVNDLVGMSVNATAMNTIASRLQTVLRAFNDTRGTGNSVNANYGLPAFPGVMVTYDSNYYNRFTISHVPSDACYIMNFTSGTNAAADIGLSANFISSLVTVDNELSQDIIEVVADLDTRSQVTIRNVYISPFIQNFILQGNVYINALYDINTEKVNIENAIYSNLNQNATLNQEIYVSNLAKLIDNFPSVKYVDIALYPEYPINPNGGSFYPNFVLTASPVVYNVMDLAFGYNSIVENIAYSIINNDISNYINGASVTSDVAGSNAFDWSYAFCGGPTSLQSYDYSWAIGINERSFFTNLAKNIYNDLINASTIQFGPNIFYPVFEQFANSDNFLMLINDIHKDFLKLIRFNMIDTKGNIANELDSTGVYIKGGYSLGNEITKVSCNLNYIYK